MAIRFKSLFAVLLLALAFGLGACVTGVPDFDDPDGSDPNRDYFDKTGKPPRPLNLVHIKVERSASMVDGARQARIGVNNNLAGYLWPGESWEGDFYPGAMSITADVEDVPGYTAIQLSATPNANYEIRVSPAGTERGSMPDARVMQYGGPFQMEMVSITPSAPAGTLESHPSQTPTYVQTAPYAPPPAPQPVQPQPPAYNPYPVQTYPPQPQQPQQPQQQAPYPPYKPYPQTQSALPVRQ